MYCQILISVVFALLTFAACASEPKDPAQAQTTPTTADGQPPALASKAMSASTITRASEGTPTKLALLVGINTYPNLSKFSQLQGAANDVERMRALLTTRFEFPPENVKILLDGEATRDNILAGFREHLVANAKAGDIVVFHYSGHGSRLDDQPDGDELDGLDETLVPANSDRHGTHDIRDDEVNALFGELNPGAQITLIFDSCHSGTATRDLEGGRSRSLNRDSLLRAIRPTGVRSGRGDAESLSASDMGYVLFSGARADQQAKEFIRDGQSYGAMTYFLTETLNQADSSMTYADLRDVVQGKITTYFANQSPQLEGPSTDYYAFSTASSLGQPHVRVAPMEDTDQVRLQAGQVHGMTTGSLFDVYAPGTKHFEAPNTPVARIKLVHAGPFTSEAEVLSGGPILPASRAVEHEHVYPNLRMKLRYEGLAASATLRAVKDALDRLTHIQAVPEDSEDFQLRLYEHDGRVRLQHDEVVFSEPVSTNEPDATGHVIQQVGQWARWFNLRAIEDATPEEPVVLHLRFDDPNADASRPWNEVKQGASLLYSFENRTDQDLYITGVALFSTGAIQPFYPNPPGAGELLKAGTKSPEIRIRNLTVPEGRPYTKDILKVFATTSPIDVSSLIQGKIRGGLDDDPLQALLGQATQGGTRDFAPEEVGAWFTTDKAYVVRRVADRPQISP